MPVRYDRFIGSLEVLEPERSPEGFLKAHGIAARTGVLYYSDGPDGAVVAELIPPEELFGESLESLGGKPLTNEHPADKDGNAVLVTPDNADEFGVGTVGNDIRGNRKAGLVRVTIDVHKAEAIADVDAGKRQLSSGRLVGRIDDTPGFWNPKTQTYTLGTGALPPGSIAFDRIQRDFTHNHLAIVPRGRAGAMVAIRMDSDDAFQVAAPETDGGHDVAFINQEGGGWVVRKGSGDFGVLSRFEDEQAAKEEMDKLHAANNPSPESMGASAKAAYEAFMSRSEDDGKKMDSSAIAVYENTVARLEATVVKLRATDAAKQVKLDALQTRVDSIDIAGAVKSRLELERSVAGLRLDGLDGMSDRDVRIAAIKSRNAKFDAEGMSDDHVRIYFDATMSALDGVKPNDGRGGLRGARHDASTGANIDKLRKERNDARGYKASIARQKER